MLSLVRPRDPDPVLEPISPWAIWPDAAPRHARPIQPAQPKPQPTIKRKVGRPSTRQAVAEDILRAMPGTIRELSVATGLSRSRVQGLIQQYLVHRTTRERLKGERPHYRYSRVGDARV